VRTTEIEDLEAKIRDMYVTRGFLRKYRYTQGGRRYNALKNKDPQKIKQRLSETPEGRNRRQDNSTRNQKTRKDRREKKESSKKQRRKHRKPH
jgi:hypothetical protein